MASIVFYNSSFPHNQHSIDNIPPLVASISLETDDEEMEQPTFQDQGTQTSPAVSPASGSTISSSPSDASAAPPSPHSNPWGCRELEKLGLQLRDSINAKDYLETFHGDLKIAGLVDFAYRVHHDQANPALQYVSLEIFIPSEFIVLVYISCHTVVGFWAIAKNFKMPNFDLFYNRVNFGDAFSFFITSKIIFDYRP